MGDARAAGVEASFAEAPKNVYDETDDFSRARISISPHDIRKAANPHVIILRLLPVV
jgi:hypothetical protein